jgi:hypothetical protein
MAPHPNKVRHRATIATPQHPPLGSDPLCANKYGSPPVPHPAAQGVGLRAFGRLIGERGQLCGVRQFLCRHAAPLTKRHFLEAAPADLFKDGNMTDKLTFPNGQTGSRYDHRRFLEIETGRCAHRAEDRDPAVQRLARRRAWIDRSTRTPRPRRSCS